ncbi:hypothetical protein THIX_60457 [Thiomonas sp. X19]|uniref:hypothetical protein n=1 Tax=Thiomonas sp. X19 TaxID=1050370 RepID=UPI000B6560A8|nr:hypothetical protein [Thiomonas sp. X19]SCC94399.1 hypothetical protein THIX_60457 [Thiomonas sp. X19]
MQAISLHPLGAISAAVKAAAAIDDRGRAFPSQVLRYLLRAQPQPQPAAPGGAGVQVPRTTLGMDFSTKTYAREKI